jgi:catechol 2,3-dioxygenase-like lactoylglutathione lyase family enzyme
MLRFTQIKETCLYIDDLDAAERFYSEGLGMPVISKVKGRHIFFRVGSSVLLCFLPEVTRREQNLPPHFAEGKQHIAFEVPLEHYQAWKEKLEALGVAITHEQPWAKGLRSFYFEDPFGHVLEIVPPGIWDPKS